MPHEVIPVISMASGETGLCAFYITVGEIRNAMCDHWACKGMFHRLIGKQYMSCYSFTLYLQAF